jgi:Mrp family chromosome partitioning ATPase
MWPPNSSPVTSESRSGETTRSPELASQAVASSGKSNLTPIYCLRKEKTLLSQDQILEALSHVNHPKLQRSLTDLDMVRRVEIKEDVVDIILAIAAPNDAVRNRIEADVRAAVKAQPGVNEVVVHMDAPNEDKQKAVKGALAEGTAAKRNHIQRVVAVMSGKGGVGKSLVTGLVAVALARDGYRVGILDADITGPSIPMLFGLHGPVEPGEVGIQPLQSETGIKIMSMNFLLESEDQPIIWRGPLIGKAITQLWGDVMWGDLDYLLVDLPPGTSDASLTTMQSLPLTGILMVTTPQGLATMIVRKAVHMAQKVGVSIIGVVENMAYFVCPDTGKQHFVFGTSHTEEVTRAAGAPLLAQLPIDPRISALCDSGRVEEVNLPEIPALLQAFIQVVPVEAQENYERSRRATIGDP